MPSAAGEALPTSPTSSVPLTVLQGNLSAMRGVSPQRGRGGRLDQVLRQPAGRDRPVGEFDSGGWHWSAPVDLAG